MEFNNCTIRSFSYYSVFILVISGTSLPFLFSYDPTEAETTQRDVEPRDTWTINYILREGRGGKSSSIAIDSNDRR